MGNDRSPGSQQHNVWKDYNLSCSMAGNPEFETVIGNKFKHSRYYANYGYLQVLKMSELKLQRKPSETIFFRCSKAANLVASDGI